MPARIGTTLVALVFLLRPIVLCRTFRAVMGEIVFIGRLGELQVLLELGCRGRHGLKLLGIKSSWECRGGLVLPFHFFVLVQSKTGCYLDGVPDLTPVPRPSPFARLLGVSLVLGCNKVYDGIVVNQKIPVQRGLVLGMFLPG